MTREDLLAFGIRLNDVIAGFAGAVVSALLSRNVTAWQAVATVVIGTLTAAYFTEPAARWAGVSDGPAGFLVGLTAMIVCQTLIERARHWKPRSGPHE